MISLLEAICHITYLKLETLEPSFNFAKIYTYTHFFICFLMELEVAWEKHPEIFLEVFINTSEFDTKKLFVQTLQSHSSNTVMQHLQYPIATSPKWKFSSPSLNVPIGCPPKYLSCNKWLFP